MPLHFELTMPSYDKWVYGLTVVFIQVFKEGTASLTGNSRTLALDVTMQASIVSNYCTLSKGLETIIY
jgi:hypothetical protein